MTPHTQLGRVNPLILSWEMPFYQSLLDSEKGLLILSLGNHTQIITCCASSETAMNYLKNSMRVKLNLANPYEIKPQCTILSKQESVTLPPAATKLRKVASQLLDRNRLSDDYTILRFGFKDPNNPNALDQRCLGLKIGQYVWIEVGDSRRPYVPISRIDEAGYIDILVRDMRAKNAGSFTQKLLALPINSEVSICGPGTQYIYEGYGRMKKVQGETGKVVEKVYKNIGIITHSSAITATYSLIESVATNYDSRTGISLLWLGDSQSDFMFVNELAAYSQQYKLNMNLMLTRMCKGWYGPYGRVMEAHLRDYMPFPHSNQLIMMSGLEGDLAYIPELVSKMGYTDYLNL